MKILTHIFLITTMFFITSLKLYSQDEMAPPKPVENKVLDAMVGEWAGESDMMGMKFNEEAKIYWNMNHQYIFMETKDVAKDNPKMAYGGFLIIGFDKGGNAKTWWFDDWGADMMATDTCTFGDMKLTMNSTNPMYKDDRSFEMKDGNMVCSWTSSMQDKNGKEQKMTGTTVYKKK